MKIKFLDGLRGIAALYVMIGHARWLLWEGYGTGFLAHPSDYSVIDNILMRFFSLFKFGHEFVLLFFVLSGFVIHLGFVTKFKKDPLAKISFFKFYYKRFKRIYPPFFFALLLTTVLDFIGKANHLSIYFGTTPYDLINNNVGNSYHSIRSFLGNLLFIYSEYVPLYGTNSPTWSLKLEWWFYLVYPFFLLTSRKNIFFSSLLMLTFYCLSSFTSFWPEELIKNVFASMLCWWLGVVIAEIFSGRIKLNLLLCSIIFFGLYAISFLLKKIIYYDLQISFIFSGILAVLLHYGLKGKRFLLLEKLKFVGDFSYTLYIIHAPILVFLSGWLLKFNNKLPQNSYFVIAGIAICLVVAYAVHFIVEVPFLQNKKKLAGNINITVNPVQ